MSLKETVTSYFQAPGNYFWEWSDDGEVIQWPTGKTICYREDLTNILWQLLPAGIPPLGPILLVLSACQDQWKADSSAMGIMHGILYALDTGDNEQKKNEMRDKFLRDAFIFLDHVNALPQEYRTGNKRALLLEGIFSEYKELISEKEFRESLFQFEKGEFDLVIFNKKRPLNFYIFQNHIEFLASCLGRFPNHSILEMKVRTGISRVPAALEVEIPEEELVGDDLLEHLENDPRTRGMTRLAKSLMAALKIPIHSRGSSDQVLGGISDISNRGNFDRLLLSELAYDDVLLMARLANNEALYLRKEELPDKKDRQRVILVDTTIRMWGFPRAFALAATLACTQLEKEKVVTTIYALTGNGYQELDFTSKEGIIEALEIIDPALHCGKSLKKILTKEEKGNDSEYYFIVSDAGFSNLDFQYYFSETKDQLDYLIRLNREGELNLYQVREGNQKLVSSSSFELGEFLHVSGNSLKKKKMNLLDAPAFLQMEPSPLYYPSSKVKLDPRYMFYKQPVGVLCISIDRRLLYWTTKMYGTIELLTEIEPGYYFFGATDTKVFVLVNEPIKKILKVYRIEPRTKEIESFDFSDRIKDARQVVYHQDNFYIATTEGGTKVITVAQNDLTIGESIDGISEINKRVLKPYVDYATVKKIINNGYSVINKVRSVYISMANHIVLDGHTIEVINDTTLRVVEKNKDKNVMRRFSSHSELDYKITGFENSLVKFSKFTWKDGSEMILDSRGLLHLKSSNPEIPEITIVLVINQPIGCWAADGTLCGSSYFTGVDSYRSMKVSDFYLRYIGRFILTIK